MSSINRIDQALLLLRERIDKLGKQSASRSANAARQADAQDALEPLRDLARRGSIGPTELRRAFVRTLLAETLGEELAGNLEFQALADQVFAALEESEAGRNLLSLALDELG